MTEEGLAEVIALIWREHSNCNWVSTGHHVQWSCGIIHPGPIHMQPTTRDRHVAALVMTQGKAEQEHLDWHLAFGEHRCDCAPSVRPDICAAHCRPSQGDYCGGPCLDSLDATADDEGVRHD
jgi:hypothetical protein